MRRGEEMDLMGKKQRREEKKTISTEEQEKKKRMRFEKGNMKK